MLRPGGPQRTTTGEIPNMHTMGSEALCCESVIRDACYLPSSGGTKIFLASAQEFFLSGVDFSRNYIAL